MSVKPEIETGGSPLDTAKLLLALACIVGGVVAYYWLSDWPSYGRVGLVLAGIVSSLLVAYQTPLGRSAWEFFQGSRIELRKMVWPTREEAVQTTIAVVVVVALLGAFMLLIDWILAWVVEKLVGTGV